MIKYEEIIEFRDREGIGLGTAKKMLLKQQQESILNMIIKDTEDDAKEFDGRSFNGKTVAEYFGNQGAAIARLAEIMKDIIGEM